MPGKEMAQRLSVVLTERVNPEMMNCEDVVATGPISLYGEIRHSIPRRLEDRA